MTKYDAADNRQDETATEEASETNQTPQEESSEVSQEFKDKVDALIRGATPEELDYIKGCCGGEEMPETFDTEGLPE